jgi:ABC-type transport system substrate-binding protein
MHRYFHLLGFVAVTVLVATACGSSGKAPAGRGPTGAPVGNGLLRIGYDLTGLAGDPVAFDPTQSHVVGDQIPWELPIYDSLLHYTASGALVPGLASSATIVNPQTIAVELRPGVQFSDGTPLDATAVEAGIMRNKAAPQRGEFNGMLQDVSSVAVNGAASLTIHLSRPEAGSFYPLLASEETFIASPAAARGGSDLNKTPVGAGPFMLKSYVPDQQIVLVKNPRYWDAAAIQLGEIKFVNVPNGPQQVNALEAGTVDLTSSLPLSDVAPIKNSSSLHADSRPADNSMLWMPVCKSAPPLSDVRVREALNYAVDRNAINQSILQGEGEPQWALWPAESIYFPKALEGHYAYDPNKARQLLAEAGYPNGFKLNLLPVPGLPLALQAAQIIQSEWKQIGVDVNISQSTNFVPDLYINHKAQVGLVPTVRGGLDKLNGSFRSGSIGDICNYDDPALDRINDQLAAATPGSPQSVQLWDQAQNLVVNDALAVWIDFIPVVTGWANRVADANMITSYLIPVPDFWTVRMTGGS